MSFHLPWLRAGSMRDVEDVGCEHTRGYSTHRPRGDAPSTVGALAGESPADVFVPKEAVETRQFHHTLDGLAHVRLDAQLTALIPGSAVAINQHS